MVITEYVEYHSYEMVYVEMSIYTMLSVRSLCGIDLQLTREELGILNLCQKERLALPYR